MIQNLFNAGTPAGTLKWGLDQMAQRQREISHRISNATTGAGSFANTLAQKAGALNVNLEQEMVALADVQLRFDAYTKLLQKTHSQLRVAFRENV